MNTKKLPTIIFIIFGIALAAIAAYYIVQKIQQYYAAQQEEAIEEVLQYEDYLPEPEE